jgi:aminopeptidase-like protein
MRAGSLRSPVPKNLGAEMYGLIVELYPICRSITGDGFRETLRRLGRLVPLKVHEVPTGTKVFDWIVPREWNIRDAYVKDSAGRRVIDFQESNLHVVSYSAPIRATLTRAELQEHLFTLPEHPDWIPYRTTYYRESWGFCVSHNQLLQMKDETYEVLIDSSLKDGHLTWGQVFLEGTTDEEVLITCHACHPSLCNDNLSGVAVAAYLARALQGTRHRFSYRFLFIPGTIGSITWLAHNEDSAHRIRHGLVLALLGDAGPFTYKRSRRGDAEIDRVAAHLLGGLPGRHRVRDFTPSGYDERQFCSPGFNLPVGSLMRTPNGEYPEYHTSADNLDFVKPDRLAESYALCLSIIDVLENNLRYVNLNPKCEPQLGRRGLYRPIGGDAMSPESETALLWVLNQSDGHSTLLDIAERSRLPFDAIRSAAEALEESGLLETCKNH